LLYVSSRPPFRTGLTAFTVSGSTPAVLLHGRHHEASLRISPAYTAFTVDSLRVRWIPLFQSFRRLGAFAMGPHPRVDGVTVLRLLRPIRHFPRSLGFRPGSPLSYGPLPFAFLGKLPVFSMEDSSGMMKVACCWLPRPRSAASQSAYRVRQVDLYGRGNTNHCSGPYSGLAPTISGLPGWHLRQGMPGARFPVGLCTLQVIHHIIPQPSHHLLGAWLPLMGPVRSMLPTS
jgi:hypothetical protein